MAKHGDITDSTDAVTQFRSSFEAIAAEWVDYNGHMNHAYYVVVFDHAIDVVLDHFGLGETYRQETGSAMYVVESHCRFLREVRLGAVVCAEAQIVDVDSKRMHLFAEMIAQGDLTTPATFEALLLHVDAQAGRACEFPEVALARMQASAERVRHAGRPKHIGQRISIEESSGKSRRADG